MQQVLGGTANLAVLGGNLPPIRVPGSRTPFNPNSEGRLTEANEGNEAATGTGFSAGPFS
jgi:hypothetical protein